MRGFLARALVGQLALFFTLAGVCSAQDATPAASDSPQSPDLTAAAPPQKHFYNKIFTLQALYSTVPSALVQQLHDWPDEWGTKRAGFEKRVASLYGQFVIGALIEDGVKAVHPEDTRYRRLGKGNFFRRTGHAVTGTLFARKPDGTRTPALSLVANSYGSWAIATLWSPREYRTAGSIAEWGSAGLSATVATNVIREYWPEIKGLFHKKK